MSRTTMQCSYFLTDTASADTPVCGERTKAGSSYCQHHHTLIWEKPTNKRLKNVEFLATRMTLRPTTRILE